MEEQGRICQLSLEESERLPGGVDSWTSRTEPAKEGEPSQEKGKNTRAPRKRVSVVQEAWAREDRVRRRGEWQQMRQKGQSGARKPERRHNRG